MSDETNHPAMSEFDHLGSEALIPTMHFRWAVPSIAAYGQQPNCAKLQQAFHKTNGDMVWRNVPIVEVR